MRLDRFTTLAQTALSDAQSHAVREQHSEIGTLHLLSALLADPKGPAGAILAKAGIDAARRGARATRRRRGHASWFGRGARQARTPGLAR